MIQSESDVAAIDIAVIGGGPAGLAAALWAGRYRRRVVLFDEGVGRNRQATAVHGYLAVDGGSPEQLLDEARSALARFPEVTVRRGVRVDEVVRTSTGFEVRIPGAKPVTASRVILATGVRDLFPPIENLDQFFGSSVFTCASCDGYEAKDRSVAVLGKDPAPFAIGLLDWSRSVTVIAEQYDEQLEAAARLGVRVVIGTPTRLEGDDGALRSIQIGESDQLECDVLFCNVPHQQSSDLPHQLDCEISEDGCVVVDDDCTTSVEHVYAVGDMTPGPHLVQVAASKGAVAGIAAATSLRGEPGAPTSSQPAPDADEALPSTS